MNNLEPDRKKELKFVRKAHKIQKTKEANAEFVSIPEMRLGLLVNKGENKEKKKKDYKQKLEKYRNRTKN